MFYDEATSAIVQVLEGPSETVRPLYEKIQADPRHNTIKLLWGASRRRRGYSRALACGWATTRRSC